MKCTSCVHTICDVIDSKMCLQYIFCAQIGTMLQCNEIVQPEQTCIVHIGSMEILLNVLAFSSSLIF